jgi:hypothetical protein
MALTENPLGHPPKPGARLSFDLKELESQIRNLTTCALIVANVPKNSQLSEYLSSFFLRSIRQDDIALTHPDESRRPLGLREAIDVANEKSNFLSKTAQASFIARTG